MSPLCHTRESGEALLDCFEFLSFIPHLPSIYSSAEGFPYKTQCLEGPGSFNPQSQFPDHSAESTGIDCIDSAECAI